ncbi:MAG: DNA (cytosine-5-)-methyltransferase [Patescibacteria group bacterium]
MPNNKKKKTIKVIDLFAGVGGFRVGLDRASNTKYGSFETIWSNQWEPATKKQHASEVYVARFGNKNHSNEDIAKEVQKNNVPDHDLLVGGFPCQDYSVARTLSQSAGIEGKKGVLWWEIYKILKNKGAKAPKYLFLENVDRLLKSPANQRGRDFAIILGCLAELGYAVEWRVINAAEYGFAQRRRRVYILGFKKGTKHYKKIETLHKENKILDIIEKTGIFAKAFPIEKNDTPIPDIKLDKNIKKISDNFNKEKAGSRSLFNNSGVMFNNEIFTLQVKEDYTGPKKTIGDIILPLNKIPKEFFIDKNSLKKWKYLKGAKKEPRKGKDGHEFFYTEGGMVFPDALDKPSRTIITGEGGASPSRFKHVIEQDGQLRRLTPLELERLCGFDDHHTEGAADVKRAFFMGNALVVGVIEKIGRELIKRV